MGFIGKTTTNAVREFGVVTEGKHQGCVMTMDNGSGQKRAAVFSHIVFMDGQQEQARYVVREDLESIHFVTFKAGQGSDTGAMFVQLKFKTGEICNCTLKIIQSDGFLTTLIKGFTGEAETFAQRQNRLYSNITDFFASTLGLINGWDLDMFSDFFKRLGLYKTNPALQKMVDDYKAICEAICEEE